GSAEVPSDQVIGDAGYRRCATPASSAIVRTERDKSGAVRVLYGNDEGAVRLDHGFAPDTSGMIGRVHRGAPGLAAIPGCSHPNEAAGSIRVVPLCVAASKIRADCPRIACDPWLVRIQHRADDDGVVPVQCIAGAADDNLTFDTDRERSD